MIFSAHANAQAACPPGMVPYGGGTDLSSCGPDESEQQAQQPMAPQPSWARTWGAIATDSVKGVVGAVTGLSSKSAARRAAMADCQAKGGAPCKFEVAYDNQCAALVVGSNGYDVGVDRTLEKVIQVGMKTCTDAKDTNCRVYYSACSLPVRIQ